MAKVFGYVRVSSTDQNEERQLRVMEEMKVPEENVYVDKQSGKDFYRTHYQEMVKELLKRIKEDGRM